ncbi:MAG: flagellar biosynthesis protein FlhA [Spirochaetales bacterium]|nr:flagellar biosynthesis protein FlhA [Spirochaetales bacterium]
MADVTGQAGESSNPLRRMFGSMSSEMMPAVATLIMIFMMIVPMPAVFLDLFMIINLLLSIVILLIILYNENPLHFSIFPTMLMVTTIFGLGLNVSSTRLILSQGPLFNGNVVKAFATFVTGSSGTEGLVIGTVIFIIIIAVQLMVITKGSSRVAEVAARFNLDALPNKHMAIDQEFSSGVITEEEYRKRKSDLQRTVDFYGAMDGATKFISGAVKVGLVITLVNVIGGLIMGVAMRGESFGSAMSVYTSLTIGDGLVSQLPALIISMSTGFIVTRSVSDNSFGNDVQAQFTRDGRVYWIAAAFLMVLGFLPGFPGYILLPLALVIGFLAYRSGKVKEEKAREAVQKEAAEKKEASSSSSEAQAIVPLDALSLELGYGLIPLVNQEQGAELLERVKQIRKEAAIDMGLVVPPIRIVDNMRLEPSEYCFKIKGVEVGRGSIRMGYYLAINPGTGRAELTGEKTTDPTYNLPALWISGDQREKAERGGYTVVDPPSIIATHLTEVLKGHSYDILGRQEIKGMLDTLGETYPAVVEETNKLFNSGEIQKVLQGLLREQVSIRNLVTILETLCDWGGQTKDTGYLIEKVRQALGRQICLSYASADKVLRFLVLDPALEQQFIEARIDGMARAGLHPDFERQWINAFANRIKVEQEKGIYPVIMTSEAARPLVRSTTEGAFPSIPILSSLEIVRDIQSENLGTITLERGEM